MGIGYRLILLVLFSTVGGFLICAYAGLIDISQAPTRRRAIFDDPHHWQILCIGIAFVLAGIQFAFAQGPRWLLAINGTALLLCFGGGVLGSLLAR